MRRFGGYVLLLLGVFLLAAGVLAKTYMYPKLAKAPLDQYSITVSEAPGSTFLNIGELKLETGQLLRARRVVRGDVNAAKKAGADDTAVYDVFVAIETGDGRLVSSNTDRVAFDRKTTQAKNCCGENVNGDTTVKHEGIEYKFPFDAKKQSYQYFDTSLRKATEIKYEATEKIRGLTVYKYVQRIEPTQIAELDVPGSLVGRSEPTVKTGRFYSNVRTTWVEPKTGVIVKGSEQQLSTLRDAAGTELLKITEAHLVFTEKTIEEQSDKAKEGRKSLNALGSTALPAGAVLGLILSGLGLLLLRGGPGSGRHSEVRDQEPARV
jgi:hypothetical protein